MKEFTTKVTPVVSLSSWDLKLMSILEAPNTTVSFKEDSVTFKSCFCIFGVIIPFLSTRVYTISLQESDYGELEYYNKDHIEYRFREEVTPSHHVKSKLKAYLKNYIPDEVKKALL